MKLPEKILYAHEHTTIDLSGPKKNIDCRLDDFDATAAEYRRLAEHGVVGIIDQTNRGMGYNKGLEGRTTHDWLNRDAAEVDKYLADERCTFTFTLNAYYSMFSGILRLHDPAFLARMPKDLPLLFLAGTADPVGDRGKGVLRAIQSLKAAGVQNIRCKLYPGARHELLVETNRQEVFADIAAWLNDQLR